MDKEKLLELYTKELRMESEKPGYVREAGEYVIRHISRHGEKGYIIYSSLPERQAQQIIQEEKRYFADRGMEFEWKVHSYDQPSNLKEILQREGFSIDEKEALMIIDSKEKELYFTEEPQINVRELTDEKGIRDLVRLEEDIWKENYTDLADRLWKDKLTSPESLFLYGIYNGDRLVSGAWMYIETGSSFASFWGGSTLPEYRGKGYYTALLAVRRKKAAEKGCYLFTVDASEMSRPILEKHGFECLAYTYGCQSPPL
ncbi:GNAT family N-acetyltransferase [Evansella sp. LMS18]|uniref:GNAT family N-acetyltransferase n=1 Tax=Evansella sp. LMS18 TaxID=2924033 RepID=UPI0020D096B0|nr:GNAT family N-acetyltransferase [Evansella sp. LMS18]UTR09847.1 GNAT family N-acetyltransferase [Evansella sp. LMS18]